MKYKLSMFSFDLPEARIAKKPASEREEAKLMIVHKKTGDIEHKIPTEKWTNFLDFSEFGFDEVLISLVR